MGAWKPAVVLSALSLTFVTLVACSSHPEQPILSQYFNASRLNDNTALANFSTVAFEPRVQGTIVSFDIQAVTPEQHKPLNIQALSKAQLDAKAADAEYTKRKDAYESVNIDAIKRVLKAESAHAPIKGKDAEVQAAWTKFRDEGAQVSKRTFDARRSLASETGVASLSVDDPRNRVDLTKYDVDMVSKEVTIDAPVKRPDGQTVQKTLVVTMQRAVLKGDKEITGRWIITAVKDASVPAGTPHS